MIPNLPVVAIIFCRLEFDQTKIELASPWVCVRVERLQSKCFGAMGKLGLAFVVALHLRLVLQAKPAAINRPMRRQRTCRSNPIKAFLRRRVP